MTLFFALVVTLSFVKYGLGKIDFMTKNADYIVPIVIIAGILLVVFLPLLKMLSIVIPMFALILLFLFLLAAIFVVMGVKQDNVYGFMKNIGFLRTIVYVLIVVAVIFAGSQIWGKQLLEKKSVSIIDAVNPVQEEKEIDFAPLFTTQVAGLGMLVLVIGMVFWWVNTGG